MENQGSPVVKSDKFSLQQIKEELKKVSWPNKKELYNSTKAVLLSTVVFGFGIYIVDLGVKALLQMISLLAKKLAS